MKFISDFCLLKIQTTKFDLRAAQSMGENSKLVNYSPVVIKDKQEPISAGDLRSSVSLEDLSIPFYSPRYLPMTRAAP